MITRTDLNDAIRSLELRTDPERLADDPSLRDQGFDSLDVVNLFLFFEERHGIKVSDQEVDDHQSIAAILRLINSKLADR